jgi:hypothetical protein
MSVRPVLLSEIRKTAAQHHQSRIGTGDYNRFSPLAPRDRAFSFGKRKLDNNEPSGNNAKTPKFDSSTVFAQLKTQEDTLAEVETALGKVNSCVEMDDSCPPKVKEAFQFFGSALKLLLKSQKNLTSTMIDGFNLKQKAEPVNKVQGKQVNPVILTVPPPEVAAEKKGETSYS